MFDFKLNEKGDIIVNKDIEIINECDELAQSVRNIVATRLKEFSLDPAAGTSWDNMLGKSYNKKFLQVDILEAIERQENRITKIDDISITETANRKLIIKILFVYEGQKKEVEVFAR